MSGNAADEPERTISSPYQPALSLDSQPALADLMHSICESTDPITIICGAGVSKDSGLPSWRELLQKLTQEVVSDLKEVVELDPIDPPRKAEYIYELRANQYLSLEAFICHGLYAGGKGDLAPGVLAEAIASFAQVVQSRVRVMTTNYDDRLESALNGKIRRDVASPRGLDETEAWWASDPARSVDVLHLHGYVPPGGGGKGPFILSESHYLEHGPRIRDEIRKALESGIVLFVGMSLTDPNLIGSLHEASGARAFSLMVPDIFETRDSAELSDEKALIYCSAQAQCRYRDLNVQTIILKSFGQVTQCINELTVAVETTTRYLVERDPVISLCYGYRFWRILKNVHAALRMTDQRVPAGGDAGGEVSNTLYQALHGPGGPIKAINLLKNRCRLEYPTLGITQAHLADEEFALFLWVRELSPDPDHPARYWLCLAGTSAYAHRSPLTLMRSVPVRASSTVAAANAVYFGNSVLAADNEGSANRNWKTLQAVPVHMSEADFDPNGSTYPVCIGGATLVSSYRVITKDHLRDQMRQGFDVANILKPSALSTMQPQGFDKLARLVADSAKIAILNLHDTRST